jgi:hypothetical protein
LSIILGNCGAVARMPCASPGSGSIDKFRGRHCTRFTIRLRGRSNRCRPSSLAKIGSHREPKQTKHHVWPARTILLRPASLYQLDWCRTRRSQRVDGPGSRAHYTSCRMTSEERRGSIDAGARLNHASLIPAAPGMVEFFAAFDRLREDDECEPYDFSDRIHGYDSAAGKRVLDVARGNGCVRRATPDLAPLRRALA